MEFEFAHLHNDYFQLLLLWDQNLGLTKYNLDAEMQGWGKGGSWEQGCQALFLMKRKWLKMAEIFAKTTENDKNWRK